MNRMQTSAAAFGEPSYAATASPVNGHFAPSATGPYEAMGYAAAPARHHPFPIGHDDPSRRFSQALVPFPIAQLLYITSEVFPFNTTNSQLQSNASY